MSIKIKVTEDNSEDILNEVHNSLERAMEKIGIEAEGQAKLYLMSSNAVDTGRLRNSISHATHTNVFSLGYSWTNSTKGRGTKAGSDETTPRATPEENSVVVGTNVEYAPYIELGTSEITPRPYLAPAFQNHLARYQALIEEELNSIT